MAGWQAGQVVTATWPDGTSMSGPLYPADVEPGDLYLGMGGGQRVHFYSRENGGLVGIFAGADITEGAGQ